MNSKIFIIFSLLLSVVFSSTDALSDGGGEVTCTIYPCRPDTKCNKDDNSCLLQKLRETRLAIGQLKTKTARTLISQMIYNNPVVDQSSQDDEFLKKLRLAELDLVFGAFEGAKRVVAEAEEILKIRSQKSNHNALAALEGKSKQKLADVTDCGPGTSKRILCDSRARKPGSLPVASEEGNHPSLDFNGKSAQ